MAGRKECPACLLKPFWSPLVALLSRLLLGRQAPFASL